jgi:hypothetical protein
VFFDMAVVATGEMALTRMPSAAVDRPGIGQAGDAALGGRVGGTRGHAGLRARRGVDDAAATALAAHLLQGMDAGVVAAQQVDLEQAACRVTLGLLPGRAQVDDAGEVDQAVEPAVQIHAAGDECRAVVPARDIDPHGCGAVALAAQIGGQPIGCGLIDVRQQQGRAFGYEIPCDRGADAATGADDDDGFGGERGCVGDAGHGQIFRFRVSTTVLHFFLSRAMVAATSDGPPG